MEQSVPYCNKTNVNDLIHGYSRKHIGKLWNHQYLPSSILAVIEYYFPKMNGHSFTWHITNYDTIQQMVTASSTLSRSPSTKPVSTFDSDVFDCGLSNKFFLQIQPHCNAVQFSSDSAAHTADADNPWEDHSRRGQRRQTNNAPNQYGYRNNVQLRTDSTSTSIPSRAGPPRGGRSALRRRRSISPPRLPGSDPFGDDNNDNDNDDVDDNKVSGLNVSSDEDRNMVLNVMAFPLPPKYRYVVFQCELYFHEIGAEFSAIWSIKNSQSRSRQQQQMYRGYGDAGDHDDDSKDDTSYTKFGWVIPYNLSRYRLSEMTFECKVNVLKIIPEGYSAMDRNRHQYPYYEEDYNAAEQDVELYSYGSVYDVQSLKKKLKFVWHINNQQGLVDKLTGSTRYKGIVQYHSDIYYDLFQLKIARENDANMFKISVVGLPKDTHKMGVKMELFAMDMSGKTDYDDNKIKIMSSIITFSYNSPTFILSKNKNEILFDLLMNYKQLRLLCTAQIIQKYDEQNNNINDNILSIFSSKSPKKSDAKNEEDDENKNEEEQAENSANLQDIDMEEIRRKIIESNKRIIELSSETFIWHITHESDHGLLDKLKSAIVNKKKRTFNSGIFTLLGHRWYLSIFTEGEDENKFGRRPPRRARTATDESRGKVQFFLNCVTKTSVDCKVNYHLLQTGQKAEFYDTFENHNWRRQGWRSPTDNGRYYLSQNANAIKTLSEITLKVDVSVIADYAKDAAAQKRALKEGANKSPKEKQTKSGDDNDDTKEEDEEDGVSKEVLLWLKETVKLPEYIELFKEHAIEDMDIVKLLNLDGLTKMGITKIGHQLKILHQIDKLQQLQD